MIFYSSMNTPMNRIFMSVKITLYRSLIITHRARILNTLMN